MVAVPMGPPQMLSAQTPPKQMDQQMAQEPSREVPAAPSRSARSHAAFRLWLLNVAVGTLVGTLWLFDSPEDLSLGLRLYVSLALVSSVAILALFPGALFVAAHRFVRRWRVAGLLQACAGSAFLTLLYTDTIIYRLLRYHFNGAVLNVALTRGSEDAVHLGPHVWIPVVVVSASLALAQYFFWCSCVRRVEGLEERGQKPALALQPRVVVLAFLLPVIGIEKSVYAAADIKGDRELIQASRALPLYPRVRLGRLLDPVGERLPELEVMPEAALLDYPTAMPELDPEGPRPSFLMLVVDSWRRDMFDAQLTPNLWRRAEGARVFADHVSGGNGTRHGLFTMLYGLHGSYWFKVLADRRSPVLIDVLQEQGYDIRVFSSASMNFPEFHDTAWVGLPRRQVVDKFRDSRGEERSELSYVRDGFVADAVEEWLDRRAREGDRRPFFCFVLLDAPHQPYFNPGGPYQPTIERLDYIELGRTTEGPELDALIERVKNTYKNSVLEADRVAGRLFGSLEDSGVMDETVVLVTGDHGEEFHECGFWGHTSSFSPQQVEVPMFVRGPGVEPGVETRPTSHVDVPNSLLELMGADRERRGDYGLGESLFDPPEERSRVVAGWSDIGLWADSGIFNIPLDVDGGELEVYDRHWRLVSDRRRRCRAEADALERMARECVRFLRMPE